MAKSGRGKKGKGGRKVNPFAPPGKKSAGQGESASSKPAASEESAIHGKPGGAVPLVLAAVLALVVLYYFAPDERLRYDDGRPMLRLHVLLNVLNLDVVPGAWFPERVIDAGFFDRVPLLLMAAGIVGVAGLAGWLLLVGLGVENRLTRLERSVFAIGLGLQMASLFALGVGLISTLVLGWACLLAAVGVIGLAAWVIFRRKAAGGDPPEPVVLAGDARGAARWLGRGFLWCLVPYVFLILWGSTMPPWDFDVREYHLQVPKEWYRAGSITFLPHNVYGNMPLGAEMHALLGMALWGDWWHGALVGKVVMGLFSPLAALAVLAAGRRFFSMTAGVAGAVLCLSTPWLVKTAATGFNEGVLAFYAFMAVYALLLAARDPRPAWILLSGFFIGSAISTKYTALAMVALPLWLWVLAGPAVVARVRRWWEQRKGEGEGAEEAAPLPKLAWQAAALLMAAAIASSGPWLVKNAWFTGNPVYPLMYSVFDGATRTPEKAAQWHAAHAPPGDTLAEKYGPTAMWHSAKISLWSAKWISPLLLPFALVSLLVRKQRPKVLALWGMLLAMGLVWWLATHRLERFLVPGLPIAALLAGVGVTWNRTPLWRHTTVGLLFWGLVLNFFWCGAWTSRTDTRYFYALDVLRQDPIILTADHARLNELQPHGSKRVLLVGDAEPFDLESNALYNTCFDDNVLEQLIAGKTPAEQRAALQDMNVSYVYVDWPEIERYRSPGNYGYTDYITHDLFRQLMADGVLSAPNRPAFRQVDAEHAVSQPQIYRVLKGGD